MGDACCGSAEPKGLSPNEDQHEPERVWQIIELRLGTASGLLLLCAFIAGQLDVAHDLVRAIEALALIVGGYTFVPAAIRHLIGGRIGVGTLMSIAAVGAVLLGQIGEAAALAFLFSLSEGLEEYSLARTRRSLRSLLSIVPTTATVLRSGQQFVVTPKELVLGDLMLVRPGEKAATDGVIRTGCSSLDLSAITGESIPVEVEPGTEVFAGAINGNGPLQIEVTSLAEDNSLARIVRIVEAEQARKGVSQRLADRIAKPVVPGIIVAAVVIAGVGSLFGDPDVWIERALVVLVAASPCAIAIAVPVTVISAIGALSRLGVLVKGGAALEALGSVRTIALDKTGTLTANKPTVIGVATAHGVTEATVLSLAASLESQSEHPVAKAILEASPKIIKATDVQSIPGAGLSGSVDGVAVKLGRPGWLDVGTLGPDVIKMQDAGATAVIVQRNGSAVGAIAVRDELRPEAAAVVGTLQHAGYSVAMLTGDNERTASALAASLRITDVHAEMRPENKAELVRSFRQRQKTAMVGDGVNDAPALATADVGIAMGAMGSDVAIETADVALMGDDLRNLTHALSHSRHAKRIMLQNLVFSLAIVVVLMPLALFGVLGLAVIVLVHELAEVLVIANGVRAGRLRR